jgi:hypothetical protein
LPNVAVHDLVIHPRDKDLIVGTHGRSIYIANIGLLQQLDEKLLAKKLHIFEVDKVRYSSRWGESRSQWSEANVPNIEIPIYVNTATTANLTIETKDGVVLKIMKFDVLKGLNYLAYDLTITKDAVKSYEQSLNKENKKDDKNTTVEAAENGDFYLQKAKYRISIEANGETQAQDFEVYVPKRRGRSVPNPEVETLD